jgi:oxygen-independent coproporphyrinogen-3 oxidase
MWELIEPTLADFGLRAYEISNYAHPGHHSRHNQGYWQGLAYLGLGAGAHSLELPPNWRSDDARAARFMNAKHPGSYMKRVADQGHAETDSEFLDLSTHLKERMFTGLRQLDGISLAAMADELGVDPALEFKATIDAMCDRRLLQLQGDTLRLTKEGLRFANDVFLAFI